ncbi:MAG TPA: MBL fold metallo-hydrolase [Puia sp.]|nr:MBL fold metallo-hydrolase [Puia sp.]
MQVEQIYTGCLSQGAYYIECNGEAAIVDPLRDTAPYLQRARDSGAVIKYILETHFHADFVSGHLDLSRQTGAEIIYGPTALPDFPFRSVRDNEELLLGRCRIRLLHTPGHTMESSCYLLKDEHGIDRALFTGDTLFIGDVGRPDLAQALDPTLTPEKLAGRLFDSLQNKILPLHDNIIVYPGHGAGSACGKNLGAQRYDTLGHQKKHNYALRPGLTKEEFIKEVTAGLTPPPGYFPANVIMNKKGYVPFERILSRSHKALSPADFAAAVNEMAALILDTRSAEKFKEGFIPGSINIGVDGNFAPWAGAMIPDVSQPVLFVADPGREEEVVTRLARVGLDNCLGYLSGGIEAWDAAGKELDYIDSVSSVEMSEIMHRTPVNLLDVRRSGEFAREHVMDAVNIPLDQINEGMKRISSGKTWYVYCAGGYRSMIFISILRARGYRQLIDISQGFGGMKASGKFCITNDNP